MKVPSNIYLLQHISNATTSIFTSSTSLQTKFLNALTLSPRGLHARDFFSNQILKHI